MSLERDADGRIKPGQKSLNPRGRPKKQSTPEIDFDIDNSDISAYDTLKFLLKVYLQNKDWAGAERVANKLAPFQTAKISSVDSLESTYNEINITLPELPTLASDDEIWGKIKEDVSSSNSSAQLHTEEATVSDTQPEDEV